MPQEILLNVEAKGNEPEPKYKDWEIDDAVRTLIHAEEIKQDEELMKIIAPKIQKCAKASVNAAKVLYGKGENNEG